jgi:hypothetical protein
MKSTLDKLVVRIKLLRCLMRMGHHNQCGTHQSTLLTQQGETCLRG